MKKSIVVGIAGAAFAAGLGFAAPTQAAPCSYFGSDPQKAFDKTFCGLPDLAASVENAQTNLRNNLDLQQGLENMQKNLDPGTASDNLKTNLGKMGLGG